MIKQKFLTLAVAAAIAVCLALFLPAQVNAEYRKYCRFCSSKRNYGSTTANVQRYIRRVHVK